MYIKIYNFHWKTQNVFCPNIIKDMHCLTPDCNRPNSQFCQKYSVNQRKERKNMSLKLIKINARERIHM